MKTEYRELYNSRQKAQLGEPWGLAVDFEASAVLAAEQLLGNGMIFDFHSSCVPN